MLILLISTQKSYFCDNDAIYDVIMQEPVWKWRHNFRHKISRDSFADLPLFKTFSIIFIFRQIDRANFAVRGPSSLVDHAATLKAVCADCRPFTCYGDVMIFLNRMFNKDSLQKQIFSVRMFKGWGNRNIDDYK